MNIVLKKSDKKDKKYMIRIDDKKTVYFGATGYSDFTKHKDKERRERYINRHKSKENWLKSGIKTAGFWSRWLLWNKPTLSSSILDIEKRFKVHIKRGR